MTANQGVKFWDLLLALKNLLQLTTQLDDRHVIMWFGPTRPALAGADVYVWFRPTIDALNESTGPVQFGNMADCNFEIHLATRSFIDESQVDERRAKDFYDIYWKIVLTFQNRNLFAKYIEPKPLKVVGGLNVPSEWVQPVPDPKTAPLSVETMLLKSLPVPDKTQKEEGTIESQWQLTVPTVLALTIP
jgi:hypothetical protein